MSLPQRHTPLNLAWAEIGADRIDLTNAANANVIAFNGSDPDLLRVSFGVVETPVNGVKTLTKNITVSE